MQCTILDPTLYHIFFFPFAINDIFRTIGNWNSLHKTSDFPGTTLGFEALNIQGKPGTGSLCQSALPLQSMETKDK